MTLSKELSGLDMVDHRRCHQTETGMVMLVVVPLKEGLAKTTSVFDGTEAIRKPRAVVEGAELAFRVWIVIGDVRPAMGLDDAQIGQQQRHGFGFHGSAAIGMDGELTRCDVLFPAG